MPRRRMSDFVIIFCYFFRILDVKEKKHHIPVVDRTPVEPPPVVVGVVGPPKVGKTTLIQCLVKNYTKQKLNTIKGPVTIVSGRAYAIFVPASGKNTVYV